MCPALTLRVHALLEHSYANGPGCRAVIWVQGCSIACPGCCNPGAQDRLGGREVPVSDILSWLLAIEGIEGITLSGGEPLQQRAGVLSLLRGIRAASDLSVVLFTGHDWGHIENNAGLRQTVSLADLVIAGPYRQHRRLPSGLRASANQTLHLLGRRYAPADVGDVPDLEVVVFGNGALVETGIVTHP